MSLTINAINDAPVLDSSGSMSLTAINEDAAASNGDLVSSLIASAGGNRVTDGDPGAAEGIAVVNADDGSGIWQFSLNGGSTWTNFGALSATSARLLAADSSTRVRFCA
jgi:hypothetical protein